MFDGFESVGKKKPSMIAEWLGIGFCGFLQGSQPTGGAGERLVD